LVNINMLLREFKKDLFSIWIANVRVRMRTYTQWIPVQVSARNNREAKNIIYAQYGKDAAITDLRKQK